MEAHSEVLQSYSVAVETHPRLWMLTMESDMHTVKSEADPGVLESPWSLRESL